MRGSKEVVSAIALACIMTATALYGIVVVPQEVSAYTPHAPIYINGDGAFTPENGVTGGSGTPADPYIVEGWEIDASSPLVDAGVYIRSTTAPFIIRDVYIHSGRSESSDGILLINVVDARVENVTSTNNFYGIAIASSNNVTVDYGNYSNGNWFGISITRSNNFRVNHAIAHANDNWGIYLSDSADGNVTNSTFDGTLGDGVMSWSSSGITFTNNSVFGNVDNGYFIRESSDFVIEGGSVYSNEKIGIFLDQSTDITIANSTIDMDGVVIWGTNLAHYNSHTITPDNTVNGDPLLYYKDMNNIILDGIQVGQLIFANCTNVRATNLEIHNTDLAIEVAFTNNSTIISNNVSNNRRGISVDYSRDVELTSNVILSNTHSGIECISSTNLTLKFNNASNLPFWGFGFEATSNVLIESNEVYNNQYGILILSTTNYTVRKNNVISNWGYGIVLSATDASYVYHNNIINNAIQGADNLGIQNAWDDGYPSGGNYWSDYVGADAFSGPNQDIAGSDGIGDTPYVIDGDSQDDYPLMDPVAVSIEPPEAPTMISATLGGSSMEDVTLTWSLSADDGAGDNSVVNYSIYRDTTYDFNGSSYQLIGVIPNGTTNFVDNLAGEGDPNNYFYRVCSTDSLARTNCTVDQAGKFTRPLSSGPNLVSIPLIQDDSSVTTILQTVEFSEVWRYDSIVQKWMWWMASKPYLGELLQVSRAMGLWINVTEDSNLTVAGIVPSITVIPLMTGWNLVAFPSFNTSYTVGDLKFETGATEVEGFDMLALPYCLKRMMDGDNLQAGYAYWVRVDIQTIWTIQNN